MPYRDPMPPADPQPTQVICPGAAEENEPPRRCLPFSFIV